MTKIRHPGGSLRPFFWFVIAGTMFFVAVAQGQQISTSLQPNGPAEQFSWQANSSSGQNDPSGTTNIFGTVMVEGGAVAVGAQVRLMRPDQPQTQEVFTGDNGQFGFIDVTPGPFELTITAPGFEAKTYAGQLQVGQAFLVPALVLNVARPTTTVNAGSTTEEVAQAQIEQQEKQRLLGIAPNFYVSYIPDAAPMSSKQKFRLAWRSVSDPVTILSVGALAGIQQATNDYSGFGQELGGYGKRFAAGCASAFSGTMIDDWLLASLMKQDPRYFYQGTGTKGSRLLHAMEHAVERKGDNGQWQFNYSGILGSFANSGVSSLYYPRSDRSAGSVVQNALVDIAGRALGGIFQEFVLRRLTSNAGSKTTHQP